MSGGPNLANGARETYGIGHKRRTEKQAPRAERESARRGRQQARIKADRDLLRK